MSSARARFYFCLAIALIVHALMLGWSAENSEPSNNLLEATRAAGAAAETPPATRVRATQNQQGEHDLSQRAQAARRPSPVHQPAEQNTRAGQKTLTRFVMVAEPTPAPAEEQEPVPAATLDREQPARAERVLAAARDARAAYLAAWQQRIEERGSRRYSRRLLQANEPRRLTMAVRITADGALRAVRVLRSSGNDDLDAAALAIVRGAAPYAPFDSDLAAVTEELSFAYDWLFEPGGAGEISPNS